MKTGRKKLQLEKFKVPLMAFGLTELVIMVILIGRGVFPFGNQSFMYMDMYHQYVPFMTELWNKLHEGTDLFYSYRVGMGSDFMALYVYYLASPLHFLAFIIPKEYVIELTTYLCVFKLGLCSFTACFYLQEHYKTKGYEKIWFSLLYSTCGFMCAYNWNIMWLDACLLMPLVMLGLEKLVKEGKCALYCIALACTIYVNYYISILLCIFLVFYFATLFFTHRNKGRNVVNFGLFSLLAGGMASVLLVPEVCAILQTSFGKSTFPTEVKAYFSIIDVLARHGVCVAAERGLEHWPNIYCGAFVFILLPCYFLNKEIKITRKFSMMLLLGLFLLGFSTNVLEFIWHGVNYPDSLPARQSFIYCFLVLVMCYEAFLHLDALPMKALTGSYGGAVAFLLLCEKLADPERFGRIEMMVTLLFVTIDAVILYAYKAKKDYPVRRVLGTIMTFAIVIETGINSFNTSLGTTSREKYLENQQDYASLAETVSLQRGQEFYRMEKFSKKTKNDGILGNYPSASLFSSTLNSTVSNLYEKLGMRYSKVFYSFDGATALIAAMFHVDYMYATEKIDDDHDETTIGAEANDILQYIDRSGNVSLYEYTYQLPFGYVAPYGFDIEDSDLYSIRLQNEMVHRLGITEDLYTRADTRSALEGLTMYAGKKGIYYMVMVSTGIKKVEMEGDLSRSYADLKKKSILYVGELQTGDLVSFKNGDSSSDKKTFTMDAYCMDTAVLKKAIDKLSEKHMENVTYDNTHISGHLSLTERGRVILSVANEEGWTVKVNGVETKPQTFGESLIALDLEAGEYDITLEFVPKGMKEGALISVISILLFAGIIIWKDRSFKKKMRRYM